MCASCRQLSLPQRRLALIECLHQAIAQTLGGGVA